MLLMGIFIGTAQAQQTAARYEINAKRIGLSFSDREALPRGREFVRLDSTYYVGWMYQGLFLDDRSADETGYQRATPFLRTAFLLLEKEFGPALQSVYSSPDLYVQYNQVYSDYINTARALRECYEYLNLPDSSMWVLTRVENKHFHRDEYGLYGTKAWLIHRNRFYTDGRFGFLKSSVQENANLALQSCYNGFANISRYEAQITDWFGPYATETDRQVLYHYLAMIHSYMQHYDSSEYYYNQMAAVGTISWNNYGSLKHETGNFGNAAQLYELDRTNDYGDKRLREPYYYLPMIQLYAGKTTESINLAKDALSMWQSMPGFGWYNIALARACLYNGQLDSADLALTKAKNFKEVHIGTTLTQPQYEFTISVLRMVWYNKKIAAIKLAHSGWWYKPSKLYEIISLAARRYADKFVLAGLLAENPERDRLIYDLFCGESTVSFDEIFAIMEAFSPAYFSRLMEDKTDTDPRYHIKKYFQLARVKMLAEQGRTEKAREEINALLSGLRDMSEFEKLFLARAYEMKASLSEGSEKQAALNKMFEMYPELVPFTGQPLRLALNIQGNDEVMMDEIRDNLKSTAVQWVEVGKEETPVASLFVARKGNKFEVTIDTRSAGNQKLVQGQKLVIRPGAPYTEEVLFRIFGKTGALEPEF